MADEELAADLEPKTLDGLMSFLNRLGDLGVRGDTPVFGNHPGSGRPWGEILRVRVRGGQFPCVVLDQGQE